MVYRRKKGQSFIKGSRKTYPFKSVDYKSILERTMAMLLDSEDILFEYEPTKIILQDGFYFPFKSYERQTDGGGVMKNRGLKKIQKITYTPDFIGKHFLIETKGYANETFPRTWKMFKKWITDNENYDPDDIVIYKPQNASECEQVVELIKQYQDERRT